MTDLERIQIERAQEQMDAMAPEDVLREDPLLRHAVCACGCGREFTYRAEFHRPPKYATDECRNKIWYRSRHRAEIRTAAQKRAAELEHISSPIARVMADLAGKVK